MDNLRKIIRALILETLKKSEKLLVEPDETEDKKEDEASSGGVAGVSVPLGVSPTHPKKGKKRKKPASIAGASFGNAKIVKIK